MGNLSSEIADTCKKATKYFGLTKQCSLKGIKADASKSLAEGLIDKEGSFDHLATTRTGSLVGVYKPFKPIEMITVTQPRKLTDDQLVKKPQISLNDFTILKLIGAGAFGKVFLVRSKRDGKDYAMKVLAKSKVIRKNQVNNTITERDLLEKVNHPFVIKLIYAFQDINSLYIVTDFMSGGDLMFNIKKEGRFAEDKARQYACEIFLALEHLHKLDIIYRDLKPENILLDNEGHIKLADLGLSRRLNSKTINDMSKLVFSICGTKQYLAPEVYSGLGYSIEIDWWSFGIVLYEMLTGKFPSYYVILEPEVLNQKCIEQGLSEASIDLITQLLKESKDSRLVNAEEIKSHPFFKGINWKAVEEKKASTPFVPTSSRKAINFDKYFINNKDEILKLTRTRKQACIGEINSLFDNFSFYPQELMSIQ